MITKLIHVLLAFIVLYLIVFLTERFQPLPNPIKLVIAVLFLIGAIGYIFNVGGLF